MGKGLKLLHGWKIPAVEKGKRPEKFQYVGKFLSGVSGVEKTSSGAWNL
jgi:hypothetical protein